MAYGLAITGHVIIALVVLLGFFERTEPASVAAMPVEIVMEETVAASPPPVSAPNEQNGLPSVPTVADADKRQGTACDSGRNCVNRPKQPGQDGGDPSSGPNETPMPHAAADLASGVSLPSWAVEPIGLAQRQATARESGQDELTAIAEPELKCGAEARRPSPRAGIRGQAEVTGIATPAQALALVRSTQVMMDRHINPNYLANMEVFTETWEGRTVVVLPAGVTVNVGDMIYFDFGHVDPSNPCQYIPNLAVSER